MTPSPLCGSVPHVPPEATPRPQPDVVPTGDILDWDITLKQVDDGFIWQPDELPEHRLHDDEGIQLETRGITSHPHRPLPPKRPTPSQAEFWRTQTAHKFTVAAKLREAGMVAEARVLEDCHSHYTYATCNDCFSTRKFPNRCDRFYCPECQPGLSNDRRRQVGWWAVLIKQPKHVVLTVQNVGDLTPGHVDELREWFSRLRRRKFARNWRGGFYAMECTNEGNGWHLHIHALVDARYIDKFALSAEWADCTRGFGRIVNVQDARDVSYLAEVTKYAVKGNQLAAWQPDQIATFIRAFQGKRTFGVFGQLYGQRTEFAEFIATLRAVKPKCDCGSCNITYRDEAAWIQHDLQPEPNPKPRPPDAGTLQAELLDTHQRWHV